jgi:hypothetical protein
MTRARPFLPEFVSFAGILLALFIPAAYPRNYKELEAFALGVSVF